MSRQKSKIPIVNIVTRCRSCDAEQLAYVETCLCCLQHLQKNLKTADGVEIKDKMRFFHADSPPQEFESGQQKGGHYYCSGCLAHAWQSLATTVAKGKLYRLSLRDQEKYRKHHKHIAPGVVRGTHQQPPASDVYGFELLFSLHNYPGQ